MGSTVRAARDGILERGELTRGPLVEVSTGQAWATVVLLLRTGPAVPTDGLVEQSIDLQQALAGLREALAGPAAAREQALLGRRRVVHQALSLAAVTRVVVTRVVVVTRAAAAGIVAITKGTSKSVKCEMPREA